MIIEFCENDLQDVLRCTYRNFCPSKTNPSLSQKFKVFVSQIWSDDFLAVILEVGYRGHFWALHLESMPRPLKVAFGPNYRINNISFKIGAKTRVCYHFLGKMWPIWTKSRPNTILQEPLVLQSQFPQNDPKSSLTAFPFAVRAKHCIICVTFLINRSYQKPLL